MRNLLGIDLNDKDCFDSIEEYKEYNNDVCDTVNGWYYVRIAGKYFGYVKSNYIIKV